MPGSSFAIVSRPVDATVTLKPKTGFAGGFGVRGAR